MRRKNNACLIQRLLAGLLGLCLLAPVAFAQTLSSRQQLFDYLTQEKQTLTAVQDIKLAPNLTVDEQLNRVQQLLDINTARQESLAGLLINQKKTHQDDVARLKKMHQALVAPDKIKYTESLLKLSNDILTLINEDMALSIDYHLHLQEQKEALIAQKEKHDLHLSLQSLREKTRTVNDELTSRYQKNTQLLTEKAKSIDAKNQLLIDNRILVNDQAIELLHHQLTEISLEKRVLKAKYKLVDAFNFTNLQDLIALTKKSLSQLELVQAAIDRMQVQVLQEKNTVDNDSYHLLLQALKARHQSIDAEKQILSAELASSNQQLTTLLATRQQLSDYRLELWPDIASALMHAPLKFALYLKSLSTKIVTGYVNASSASTLLFWSGLVGLGLVGFLIKRQLRAMKVIAHKMRLSRTLIDMVVRIVIANSYYIAIIVSLVFICFMTDVPVVGYYLVLSLLVLGLFYRVISLMMRILLLERLSNMMGKDVKLYHLIKLLLVVGTTVTGLMIVSQQLPLTYLLQDLFNRLFMMFLLATAVVLWQNKRVISELIVDPFDGGRLHIHHALKILLILLPLTIITTATIGLFGYINFAWTMSQYQMMLLALLTSYIVVRGLLLDGLEVLADWMVTRLHNGWLWVDVLLKPFDKLLRIVLVLVAFLLVLNIFSVRQDSYWVDLTWQMIKTPLVNLSGFYITTLSIIEFFIVLSVFIWAARWTREFCYRWIFRNVRDAALRNSLSIFTQYFVICIGALITLRVLGLDFSGLSMILGGLAVGMGFGLRDFASNIVGGIMLLIERPVREGDLITLGQYEGRVAHIGIRTMRVSTWDNMEVLIPNAETFNKPFTNWTHQDSVIRTVVPIKISRVDDPIKVHDIITRVLAGIPEILNNPPFQVFLKQIDDALIEFELRYFMNVELFTRVEIRSKVLFAIHKAFMKAGIKPPIPPLAVELLDVTPS